MKSVLIPLQFLTVVQHESSTITTIFWSVTVYNKNLFSQSNLPAPKEPVQDEYKYMIKELAHVML